ncbi:MAG: nucleotide exchange factor GrpE [Spirochaetaceae bacterium]|jgi:molecular chaperone GrpE|nr:nucleotide exchange factor GrpE [Spirochaetaceae bacterium]
MSKHTSHEDERKQGEIVSPEDTEKQGPEAAEVSASAETGCGADEGEAPDPAARIQALEIKLAEANDQYLRKAADFENFRKRMNREKQEAIDFANQALLLDLIPIIDDFERAVKSSGAAGSGSPEFQSLYEGINMIEKRLVSQLENKWGLKRFDSAGEAFDPTRHEAIMMEKSAEVSEPMVAEDFIKGYMLKDRVVRSAKVKVLMPEEPQNDGERGAET